MPSVPLMSASPSFARSTTGSRPAPASASPAGVDLPSLDDVALADHHQRAVGERGEVAARTERAVLGHDGRQAGVEQRHLLVDEQRAGTRSAHRQAPGAQQEHRPHDLALDRLAHAGGMRADERDLELAVRSWGITVSAERAEPGGDAVDRLIAGDEAVDERRRPDHLLTCRVGERDGRVVAGDGDDVGDRQPGAPDLDRSHLAKLCQMRGRRSAPRNRQVCRPAMAGIGHLGVPDGSVRAYR